MPCSRGSAGSVRRSSSPPTPPAVRRELARLVVDVRHHLQRLHDLAYDEVALELGGSD